MIIFFFINNDFKLLIIKINVAGILTLQIFVKLKKFCLIDLFLIETNQTKQPVKNVIIKYGCSYKRIVSKTNSINTKQKIIFLTYLLSQFQSRFGVFVVILPVVVVVVFVVVVFLMVLRWLHILQHRRRRRRRRRIPRTLDIQQVRRDISIDTSPIISTQWIQVLEHFPFIIQQYRI